jgi:hypothetical protein
MLFLSWWRVQAEFWSAREHELKFLAWCTLLLQCTLLDLCYTSIQTNPFTCACEDQLAERGAGAAAALHLHYSAGPQDHSNFWVHPGFRALTGMAPH